MKIVEQTEAKAPLADHAASVAQEPVVVTVNGKPVAVLVAIENADLETVSLSADAAFLALLERSRATAPRAGSPVRRCDAVQG
jgi:prevent-host-death family protein